MKTTRKGKSQSKDLVQCNSAWTLISYFNFLLHTICHALITFLKGVDTIIFIHFSPSNKKKTFGGSKS